MKIVSLHQQLSREELLSSIFVYPSDTCYGLGCNALDEQLVQRIKQIKQRDGNKPLSIMVNSFTMLKQYGDIDAKTELFLQQYLPGELTIVVPKTKGIPSFLNPIDTTIGIRFPIQKFCMQLIEIMGVPIITTSANVSGKDTLYDVDHIMQEFQNEQYLPDICFDGGVLPSVPPSTVVSVIDGSLKVLRQGRIQFPVL